MRFIDLFSGLGGFNLALSRLGHECVFACEIDNHLRDLYESNFGIKPEGNIREINVNSIPAHDILCAGFPCQPFSKAGAQSGLDCPKWGDLFYYIIPIIEYHRPRYFILENVPNLLKHNNGKTWETIRVELKKLEYSIEETRLSPHQFGIPQIRDRLYIVGSLDGLVSFSWPKPNGHNTSIKNLLDKIPNDSYPISQQIEDCLSVWQNFISKYPEDIELPSFPIWSMEFGADYPYENTTPYALGEKELGKYKGSHGQPLIDISPSDRMDFLPSYSRVRERRFPSWKINYIRKNRELYAKNKEWIDKWLPSILRFPTSLQKLEWNCKGEVRDIWRYVIQMRPSGVRVKRPNTIPSLVAMNLTQVPIIAWERRYVTPRECAHLQGLGNLELLPDIPTHAYRALGNAVNSDVVELIASELIPDLK